MPMPKRTKLTFMAFSLAAILGGTATAGFPEHPIKLVVGFPAGQSSDASARRMAQSMSVTLKQTVFVENRPGAAGIISHEAVKNAPADGYTLLMGSTGTLAINPSIYRKLPYDPAKDFEPVSLIAAAPLVLFAAANSPVNNLQELIAYTKARPGKVSYGSGGSGTTQHIAMEMLKKQAGIFMLHIPYKGSSAMITDVIGGQIDFAFEPAGAVLPFVKTGRIKLLGFATAKRNLIAPDVPTLAEQGLPGFEAVPWSGILAPKGTPPEIIQQLNEAVNKALKDPVVTDEFARTASYALGGSPAEFRKFMQADAARWGKAVKASGAQVD